MEAKELAKYENTIKTLKSWDEKSGKYFFIISFEKLEEPGKWLKYSLDRDSGHETFKQHFTDLMDMLNVSKIKIEVYPGTKSKNITYSETIEIRSYHRSGSMVMHGYAPEKPIVQPTQPQPQSPQPEIPGMNPMDIFSTFLLGKGGLNGTEMLSGLLDIRDKQIEERYSRLGLERENRELREQLAEAKREKAEINAKCEELEDEIDELTDKTDILSGEIEQLQKYKPGNSPIGISLTALGSAILEKTATSFLQKNTKLASGLFGVDEKTIKSFFDKSESEPQNENDLSDLPNVNITSEELTPEQEAAKEIADWIVAQSPIVRQQIVQIINEWVKDIKTVSVTHDFVFATE